MDCQAISFAALLALCSNTGMSTANTLVSALRALCEREGGHEIVAAETHSSAAYLWQILHEIKHPKTGTPRGVGRQLQQRLDRRYPGWTNTQHWVTGPHHAGEPVAQYLSQPMPDPPILTWEDLMKSEFPAAFRVQMRDDSMAPWLLPGDIVTFRIGPVPTRGQPVLLRVRGGDLYVRLYRERTAGRWIAAPLNPDFDSLDSETDGLDLVAVFEGMSRPSVAAGAA